MLNLLKPLPPPPPPPLPPPPPPPSLPSPKPPHPPQIFFQLRSPSNHISPTSPLPRSPADLVRSLSTPHIFPDPLPLTSQISPQISSQIRDLPQISPRSHISTRSPQISFQTPKSSLQISSRSPPQMAALETLKMANFEFLAFTSPELRQKRKDFPKFSSSRDHLLDAPRELQVSLPLDLPRAPGFTSFRPRLGFTSFRPPKSSRFHLL